MTRFLDSLAAALAGMFVGVVLMSSVLGMRAFDWSKEPAPRPSPHADPGPGTPGMTTEPRLPSPDDAGRTGAPSPMTVTAIGTRPAPPTAAPDLVSLRGIATWYRSPAGVSAAGPALRAALPGWRGRTVVVTGPAGRVTTVLGDWMRADRLIDLHAPAFVAACGSLSIGVCTVTVRAIPAPPDTSTEALP